MKSKAFRMDGFFLEMRILMLSIQPKNLIWVKRTRMDIMQNSVTFFQLWSLIKPIKIPIKKGMPFLIPKVAPVAAKASGAGPGEPSNKAVMVIREIKASNIFYLLVLFCGLHCNRLINRKSAT